MSGRSLTPAALLLAAVIGWTTVEECAGEESNGNAVATAGQSQGPPIGQKLTIAPEQGDSAKGEPRRIVPKKTRIVFITTKDCERCERELARLRKPGGDFEVLRARGWKIGEEPDNHLQIVDRDELPEFLQLLEIREYPTVACISNGEILRSFKDGCTTPLDVWTFGWLIKGKNERPQAAIPEPIRVASTGSYPLRGNHWSVDGDWKPSREKLLVHLRGPNHGSQIASNWAIETWSHEELRSVHDDLHEREMAANPAAYAAQYQPAPRVPSEFSASRKILDIDDVPLPHACRVSIKGMLGGRCEHRICRIGSPE